MKLLKILREEKSIGLKGGIYHQTQVKLAYNSNRIEGSKLSEEQTRYIYETNTIFLDNGTPYAETTHRHHQNGIGRIMHDAGRG